MEVSIDLIKQLREETGISIAKCKEALEETGGDIEKAKEVLRKQGQAMADKKSDREVGAGLIDSYIHQNGQVGVLLDLRCETDFVSRSDDFKNLSHEICLQIASMGPRFIKAEDIPEEVMSKEKEIFMEQMKDADKPVDIKEQIVKGKIEKFEKEICLLSQVWVKDDSRTIKDLINDCIAKVGENIVVNKFTRYEL